MSHDTAELIPPTRTMEKRGRGIFIKKTENLQRVLAHYAAVEHQIKHGVGLKDGERWYELWFMAPITAAAAIAEYETFQIAYMQDCILEFSPEWATRILENSSQIYQFVAKIPSDVFEIWHIPQNSFGDNTIPVAYQAFPKEWVTLPELEIFIAPTFEAKGGVEVIQHLTEHAWQTRRTLASS
jgi:hypothetical protein